MESDSTQILHRTPGSRAKATLAWLVILALVGLVAWLASERNARRFYLVPEGGQLVVKKGMLLPAGRQDLKGDPALAQVYAPLAPPPSAALPQEQTFDDRTGLDQALYDLLARWARDDISSERPELLQRGLGYVTRAKQLSSISTAQHGDLDALSAESGFYEARGLLERGSEELRQAREKLRLASQVPGRHAAEASSLLHRIDPIVEDAFNLSRELNSGRREASPAPAQPSPAVLPSAPPPPAPPSQPTPTEPTAARP